MLPSDPVIEAYKRDVDRTLLRENLRRSPEERGQALINMAQLVEKLHAARKPRKACDALR
jgi:hypothetical protein